MWFRTCTFVLDAAIPSSTAMPIGRKALLQKPPAQLPTKFVTKCCAPCPQPSEQRNPRRNKDLRGSVRRIVYFGCVHAWLVRTTTSVVPPNCRCRCRCRCFCCLSGGGHTGAAMPPTLTDGEGQHKNSRKIKRLRDASCMRKRETKQVRGGTGKRET